MGHISRNCPERRALLWREEAKKRCKGSGARQNGICLLGTVEGQKTKIHLDTGAPGQWFPIDRLVPLENYLEGKAQGRIQDFRNWGGGGGGLLKKSCILNLCMGH